MGKSRSHFPIFQGNSGQPANQFKTKQIKGIVVWVEKRKSSDAVKRGIMYVTGKYSFGKYANGNQEYKVKG